MRAPLLLLVLLTASAAAAAELDVAEALGRAHASQQTFVDGLHLAPNTANGGFPSVGPAQGLLGALRGFAPVRAVRGSRIDTLVSADDSAVMLDRATGAWHSTELHIANGTWRAMPGYTSFTPSDPTRPTVWTNVLRDDTLAPIGRRTSAALAWRHGRDFARELKAAQAAGERVVVRRTIWQRGTQPLEHTYQVKLGARAWRTVAERHANDVLALGARSTARTPAAKR